MIQCGPSLRQLPILFQCSTSIMETVAEFQRLFKPLCQWSVSTRVSRDVLLARFDMNY